MKKIMKFSIFIFITIMLATVSVQAQKGTLKLNLNYSYSLPLESFKNDIVSNGSPRGVSGELMYFVNNKWSLGLAGGFQDYYQKYPRALYQTGDHETTSAVLSNSVQVTPILFKAMLMPCDKPAMVHPYISAGAGLGIVDFTQYLGEFGGTANNGSFMAQAGAGVQIPFSKTSASGFQIGANYNYISYKQYGFSNLNNLSFEAGLHFPIK